MPELQDLVGYIQSMTNAQCLFNVGSVLILVGALFALIDVLHMPGAAALVLLYLFLQIVLQVNSLQLNYQSFANMLPSFANIMDINARCEVEVEREAVYPEGAVFAATNHFGYGLIVFLCR